MKTVISKQDDVTLVTIEGRLDTTNSKDFEEALQPVMSEKGINIVVDCEQLTYISSSGLRVFMSLLKVAKINLCTLVLEKMNAEVKSVFDMTGFSNIFTIR